MSGEWRGLIATRRDWLERTALAAAALGLPGAARAELRRVRRAGERRYLDHALRCARWIAASEQRTQHGRAWPADPEKPESVGLDFYNGMPGIVVFLAGLSHATGDPAWLTAARAGADHLAAELDAEGLDAGLYTGLAGLAFTFRCLEVVDPAERSRHRDRLGAALGRLRSRAVAADGGVHWNGSHDIISGNAGIGLLLLEAERWTGDAAWAELARRAGERLVAVGEPAEGGRMWYPSATLRRNLPNFSHGTAGVAYFLATLHERTADRRFLQAALDGARYLEAIATRRNGATVIRHHDGDGADLFYLSWCHGPAGTARLFHRLHRLTGDGQWLAWVRSLTRGILASGIPEQRTRGFWNNISQCCGNVGVGQYFLDIARAYPDLSDDTYVLRVADDTLRRATGDGAGLRWVQAEHRVQPENLVAQTGFMQGAAGVGTFFLRLDAVERGAAWPLVLPDSPFTD